MPHADPGRQGDHLTTWTPGHPLTSGAAGVRRADGHLPGGGQLPHRDGWRQRAARPQAAARGHQQDIYISIYISTYLHIYIFTHLQVARRERLSVDLDNVTERLGTLTVAGPRARQLMARLCHQDTSGSDDIYISTQSPTYIYIYTYLHIYISTVYLQTRLTPGSSWTPGGWRWAACPAWPCGSATRGSWAGSSTPPWQT